MKKLFVFFVLVLFFVGGGYLWWVNGLGPADSSDKSLKNFTIMKGEGTRQIADDLKKSGLIRDSFIFFLMIKKTGVGSKIQAGEFMISPSMSAYEILQRLRSGTFDISITIPEGKRADEIADILKYNFPNYQNDWRKKLEDQEGYLFPDTYYFPKDADIDLIIGNLKDNFNKKFPDNLIPSSSRLTKREVVIIASMVEREVRYDEDRSIVASVILNRYNMGMKLDLDPTVQYALGYQPSENSWWKKDLTSSDLMFDSDYNTYINSGLPPGPISNPGLKSLMAVLNPKDTNYLFYVSDHEGHNHYAATLEGHNLNVSKYR